MKRIGVIGASGYTGGELLRILARHPEVEVACATSRGYAGKKVHSLHPNLRGVLELVFQDLPPEKVAGECDLVFTALPHGTAMDAVAAVLEAGARAIDLSADFRFRDAGIYEKCYGREHKHPEIKAVYGLTELHREEVRKARLVANPGCYPTATILALAPLLQTGVVEAGRIVADAKSGVSGAGAKPTPTTHFCSVNEGVLAYSPRLHRHLPEMEQELSHFDRNVRISFVPHLLPVTRGISTTHHCYLTRELGEEEVRALYEEFYGGEEFIRVLEAGETPRLSGVRGSNNCDIGCFAVDMERRRLVVVSALDNLVKGAAGQAVQNMNLMLGLEETLGLKGVALHP